jgi:hypothetical protein
MGIPGNAETGIPGNAKTRRVFFAIQNGSSFKGLQFQKEPWIQNREALENMVAAIEVLLRLLRRSASNFQ